GDSMNLSQVRYLPLAPPFFFILVGLFVILLVLIQLGVLRYAYMRLGISSGAALLLLFASLIGSYFNIPVAYLPEQRVLAQQEIDFFGMRYVVPVVVRLSARQASIVGRSRACHRRCRGGVLLAIPSRANTRRRWRGRPIPGLGIAEPVFVPSVTTAIVA